ncbi:MAG: deoxyribodipyrimidine photo-lyase, partial [Armatimonadota bacterium]|nr:deoxyribodipyrimidine photo-lyase [Armatimonadota bacterium]
TAALRRGGPVVPLFVLPVPDTGAWALGAAARWWLHHSLAALDADLRARGARLLLRVGDPASTVLAVAREVAAERVCFGRRYDPAGREEEARLESLLRRAGIACEAQHTSLLLAPEETTRRDGGPYRVFTPFWNALRARLEPSFPTPAPVRIPAPAQWPEGASLASLSLLPKKDWAKGLRECWQPGEAGAVTLLRRFAEAERVSEYAALRDRVDLEGTSRLSPHLRFGEVSPRQVWHAVFGHPGDEAFLRQLAWREFAYHVLWHFPHTPEEPLRPQFARFPWREDADAFRAWCEGRTGYPLVDAGMRELWHTGWMHNRARMVSASFLTKHLLIPWQAGARWFWDTLVDADLANNTFGWQWTAGCGADAAPYFRVFNPTAQGERFDPHGAYVRRWVPELAHLPNRWIHRPWQAPPGVLTTAGVELGRSYPHPIVDHLAARNETLEAFSRLRAGAEV